MMAGVTVVAWYPITPSSSLCESLIGYMKKYRVGQETGKATFAIVQAEDEIASLGMVIGASWAGARVDDGHRRPGHLADGRVHRARVLRRDAGGDLRRAARRTSTGLPTRTAQGDLLSGRVPLARRHKHMMLFPSSVEGVLHDGAWRRSISPNSSRRRCS
jgi:2-oxoglutarate ferredoxin oxidoreductase subunit alpha